MNLKGKKDSERRQSQKASFCLIPFIWYSQEDKIIVISGCQGLGKGEYLTPKGQQEEVFGRLWNYIVPWLVVVVTQIYICVKMHRTTYQKMNEIVC